MKYMSFYRLTRLLCVARENTSEQSDTILIESRIIILKQLIVNSSIFHKPSSVLDNFTKAKCNIK